MTSFDFLATWEERMANGGTTDKVVTATILFAKVTRTDLYYTLRCIWQDQSAVVEQFGRARLLPSREFRLGRSLALPNCTITQFAEFTSEWCTPSAMLVAQRAFRPNRLTHHGSRYGFFSLYSCSRFFASSPCCLAKSRSSSASCCHFTASSNRPASAHAAARVFVAFGSFHFESRRAIRANSMAFVPSRNLASGQVASSQASPPKVDSFVGSIRM